MEMDKLIQHLRFCGDLNANCHECERYYEMGTDGGTASCVNDLMQKAADALESERQVWLHDQERNRWIPVTERLPEAEGVLATDGKNLYFTNGSWLYKSPTGGIRIPANYGTGANVTHWMPLPTPPTEV